jgi:hypothetical protein
MSGLHYVNGDWLVDDDGQEVFAKGDFWTLSILAKKLGVDVKTVRFHRGRGRFPTLRIKETGQHLVLPALGEAIVKHFIRNTMWLTFRIVGNEILLFSEEYGSRPIGREVLVETGQLHVPAGAPLPIAVPLDVPDEAVD